MGKNGFYIAVVIGCLLLFVVFFRRRKQTDFDSFFGDTEIVKEFDEPPVPTAVPAALMNATQDSGNGNTECEKSGYVALTLTNPSTVPVTVNLIDVLASANAATATSSVPTPSGVYAMLVTSDYIFALKDSGLELYAYNYATSTTTTIALPLAINDGQAGSISQANGNLYIVSRTIISVVSMTTLELVTQFTVPGITSTTAFNALYTSFWKNNLYVAYKGLFGNMAMAIIDTLNISISFVDSSLINLGANPNICALVYPKYNYGESGRYGYITVNDIMATNRIGVFDFEDNVFVTSVTGLPAAPQASYAGRGATMANGFLYVPGSTVINIIDTSTNAYLSSISSAFLGFSIFNNQNYIYSNASTEIKVIDINTNTIVDSIVVSPISDSTIINNILYVGSNGSSANAYAIDVNESNVGVVNTVIKSYNLTPATINISMAFNQTNVIMASVGVESAIGNIPIPVILSNQAVININSMANFINNPGEICGIFYRSLTVAQMSNAFSIDWTEITGNTNNYKLIPITYKDTMSMLNQIYVSKFFKPIIINNNLAFYHVINPGEDVYVKIYVRKFISTTDMLKTGKIAPTNTNGFNPPEPDEDNEDEGWMDVEEVEEGEWGAVHIQCPEPTPEIDETDHEYESEPDLENFEEEFEDEFGEDGWLAGGLR